MAGNENKLELRIDVVISQPPGNYAAIRLSETLLLPSRRFMEMCQILAEFEKLAEAFRKENI